MARIPAYCPKCKSIFASPVGGDNGAMISITSVNTNCPVCGSLDAKVSEGLFATANNAITILSGPAFSRDTLEVFRGITKNFAEGTISKEEAQQQSRDISPQLETLFNKFFSFGIPALMLLIAIIGLYLQYEGNISSSEDSKKILDALLNRPYSVQELHHKDGIEKKSQSPSESKPTNKPSLIDGPAERKPSNRQKVSAAKALHRRQFYPSH
jgi:hypothetical protein